MNTLQKLKVGLVLVCFAIVAGLSLGAARAKAIDVIGIPWGGFVVDVFECFCEGPVVMFVLAPGFVGPVPAVYEATYVLGSQIFAYWDLGVPAVWGLGFASDPPIPCLVEDHRHGEIICIPVGWPVFTIEPFSGSSL